jgi:hypothetical protein
LALVRAAQGSQIKGMMNLRRVLAAVAAVLMLLSPPMIDAVAGQAHHAINDNGGHAAHDHHRAMDVAAMADVAAQADPHESDDRCQTACAALQALPHVQGSLFRRGAFDRPDDGVVRPAGRVPAPEPHPPRFV